MILQGIPAEYILGNLCSLRPFFEKFTQRGEYPVEAIVADLLEKKTQCWVVLDGNKFQAVALTRIDGIGVKVCNITHLTGDGLREWEHLYNGIVDWARSIDCTRVKAIARPGYERIGQKYGLKKTHILLEAEI